MSVKKTSMLNPVKSLGYIRCYSSSSPRPLKALTILSDTTVRTSAVDWEDLKPYWKSEIRLGSSSWSTILLFPSFFNDLPNHRKETNRVRVFSRRPFPNSLKYRDHQWDLDGVQLPKSSSHFKEAVCFLPLSSQKFLVLILPTSEGWKAELTLEPPSGFKQGPLDWESSVLTTRPFL